MTWLPVTSAVLRAAPFLAAAVLLAVLVHILAVLAMPAVALRTSGEILAARAEQPGLRMLPAAAPGQGVTPFADPAMLSAVCAFDLTEGPFRIRAAMPDGYFSLVLLSPKGQVAHGITDKAATRRLLDVVVATEAQARALEAQDPEDRPPQEIRLRMQATSGVAVLRALSPRPSDAPAVAEVLRRAQCVAMTEP